MISPRLLIALGLITLAFGASLIFQRYSTKKLSFKEYNYESVSVTNDFPAEIRIPRLKTALSIYPAQIQNNSWQATSRGVSYLVTSPIPGTRGNSVIYGHNWASLLGPLMKVTPGDEIEIIMSNKQKKTFVVEYTSLVSADEVSILAPSNDSRVTIYTCAGFLDTKRFVATALLKS